MLFADVTTLHDEIVKITPTGLVTASGKEVHVDIIACGTGFDTAIIPHLYACLGARIDPANGP